MTQTFTPNDLVRYIYSETIPEETTQIKNVLLFDEALAQEYAEMMSVVSELDSLLKAPAQSAVDSIVNYSRSYH